MSKRVADHMVVPPLMPGGTNQLCNGNELLLSNLVELSRFLSISSQFQPIPFHSIKFLAG